MTIPKVKKVLYATDLSDNARYAFRYAVSMAHCFNAGITILHVLEIPRSYVYDLSNYLGAEQWAEIRKNHEQESINTIKERLADFSEEVAREFPSYSIQIDDILVVVGDPVEQILQHAENDGHDLLIMGTHGHGILADVMIGSIARRVTRRCQIPVLTIRLPEHEKLDEKSA